MCVQMGIKIDIEEIETPEGTWFIASFGRLWTVARTIKGAIDRLLEIL